MSIDDATDGDTFAAYLEQVLLPVLRQRKPEKLSTPERKCIGGPA
jgi:hypothetical protein